MRVCVCVRPPSAMRMRNVAMCVRVCARVPCSEAQANLRLAANANSNVEPTWGGCTRNHRASTAIIHHGVLLAPTFIRGIRTIESFAYARLGILHGPAPVCKTC